jgi:hypothetical protein
MKSMKTMKTAMLSHFLLINSNLNKNEYIHFNHTILFKHTSNITHTNYNFCTIFVNYEISHIPTPSLFEFFISQLADFEKRKNL